jgi:hypothetical protein
MDFTFRDCQFFHETTATHSNAKDIFTSSFNANVTVKFYDCYFYRSNSLQNNDYVVSLDPSGSGTSYVEFHNCLFTNATVLPVAINAKPTTPIVIDAACRGLQPFEVGDGAQDSANVIWKTNVTGPLIFGGNAVFGNGPSITTSFPSTNVNSTNLIFSAVMIGPGDGLSNTLAAATLSSVAGPMGITNGGRTDLSYNGGSLTNLNGLSRSTSNTFILSTSGRGTNTTLTNLTEIDLTSTDGLNMKASYGTWEWRAWPSQHSGISNNLYNTVFEFNGGLYMGPSITTQNLKLGSDGTIAANGIPQTSTALHLFGTNGSGSTFVWGDNAANLTNISAAALPALGAVYPNALTNNDTRAISVSNTVQFYKAGNGIGYSNFTTIAGDGITATNNQNHTAVNITNGMVTYYNGDPTYGGGVPAVVYSFDTNQTTGASIPTNTFYTAHTAGLYMWVSYMEAQGSAGTLNVEIEWADDMGLQTNTPAAVNPTTAGARGIGNRLPIYLTNNAAFKFGAANSVVGTNIIHWSLIRLQ